MKKWVFLILVCCRLHAQGATVELYYDTLQKPKYQEFHYLQEKIPHKAAVKVALVKAVGSLSDPVLLFEKARELVQPLGANAFRIERFPKFEDQSCELALMGYFASDSILGANFSEMPRNRIYVLGSPDIANGKTQKIVIDGKKIMLAPGNYTVIYTRPGTTVALSSAGKSLSLPCEKNQVATYYGLFPIKPADHMWEVYKDDGPSPPEEGIFPVNPDLAQAMLKIYKPAP